MRKVKQLTGLAFAPFLIGLIGFFNLTQRPRFAAIHTVDVVQLLASGACFGVAITAAVAMLRSQRSS